MAVSLKKLFFEDTSAFCGQLVPLFWTLGDINPGLQSFGVSLLYMLYHLHTIDSSGLPLV